MQIGSGEPRLRVAIVTESYPPQVNGVAHATAQLADQLTRRGHVPLVIAPSAARRMRQPDPDFCSVVRVPAVSLPGYADVRVALPGRGLTAALAAHRPDIVHLSSPFFLGLRGAAAARRLGVPVLAVYETEMAEYIRTYLPMMPGGSYLAWQRLRSVHTIVDRTLALSSASGHALAAHGIPRVHMLRYGVDSVRFHPNRRDEELRRQLAPEGTVLIGYVGRLAPEKHVNLLRGVCELPGVRVVVVGDGPSARPLRKALPGAVFLGRLVGNDLARVYASLDVFAHTGPLETFGMTIQEAMASGLPVIAPASGGPLDLVDHGRTGLLTRPHDARDLCAGVRALVASPEKRRAFGRAARASAVTRTWAAAGDQLIEHYTQVLDRRTSPVTGKAVR
ncbi:phosphatidylinositol alpha 1,6-mannosyltransferase [Kibdelosporangium aridum]|uniref:Phosphatidylinositol alpha 1,6-mannosyltransferase n=1 Tax=Kibdelosporangium aridum TaxID=2030 RepID=A0A1W2FXR4_KIBAR|nr:phosphatidylinositol alpha 1,6-mannosyltransferase [Kibdelosporangium aridum]